jgi:hypothetical protein
MEFNKTYYHVIQPYIERNLLFANNGLLFNSIPPLFDIIQVQPSGESLTNYVALLWVKVGQPCSMS